MSTPRTAIVYSIIVVSILAAGALIDGFTHETHARNNIRDAFFRHLPRCRGDPDRNSAESAESLRCLSLLTLLEEASETPMDRVWGR